MSFVCVDAGFLVGLYDESDQYHGQAQRHFFDFFDHGIHRLLIPWPILYESVSTKMVKRRERIAHLERDWKKLEARQRLLLLDDREFRLTAMEQSFVEARRPQAHRRALSLTDRVIRSMLSDVNLRIDVFITFNARDFHDVCAKRRQTLISA